MKQLRALVVKGGLVVAVLVVLAVVAEVVLRLAGHFYLGQLEVQKAKKRYFKQPGAVRFLALGESSTVGLWVNKDESYPFQLRDMLRQRYGGHELVAVVPPHIGQNTSQMANRIERYLELYDPTLVILMVGANNEWSLAESHLPLFLDPAQANSLRVRFQVAAHSSRVFKALRYAILRFVVRDSSEYTRQLKTNKYVWGGPELNRYPPEEWIVALAREQRDAVVQTWRYDVGLILDAVRAHGAKALLMTYHLQPAYLPVDEVVAMAEKRGVALVRNDLSFAAAMQTEQSAALLLEDNWHPSPAGYQVIAATVRDAIVRHDLLDLEGERTTAAVPADATAATPALEVPGS